MTTRVRVVPAAGRQRPVCPDIAALPASGRHYHAGNRIRPAAGTTTLAIESGQRPALPAKRRLARAVATGSENDVALSAGDTLRAEAALVDLAVAVAIDQQHGAGAGAVVVAADEGRAQPALALQTDAGVGQVAVGGAVFVGQRGPERGQIPFALRKGSDPVFLTRLQGRHQPPGLRPGASSAPLDMPCTPGPRVCRSAGWLPRYSRLSLSASRRLNGA